MTGWRGMASSSSPAVQAGYDSHANSAGADLADVNSQTFRFPCKLSGMQLLWKMILMNNCFRVAIR